MWKDGVGLLVCRIYSWIPKFGTDRSKWSAAAIVTGERSVAPWQPVRTLNMSAKAAIRRKCVIPPACNTVARM